MSLTWHRVKKEMLSDKKKNYDYNDYVFNINYDT